MMLPLPSQALLKVVVAYNRERISTSTSNPIEDHIRKGTELALSEHKNELSISWIDHSETTKETLIALKKINDIKPDVVIGMGDSAQALLAAEILQKAIWLITPVATVDSITEKSEKSVLVSNSNDIQAQILAKEIVTSPKPGEIAIVHLYGCTYCTDLSARLQKSLKIFGKNFDVIEAHQDSLGLGWSRIKKEYGHVIIPSHEATAGKVIKELSSRLPATTFWGADGWGTLVRFIRDLPNSHQIDARWLSHYHKDFKNIQNRKFVDRFKAKYKCSAPR